MSKKSMHLMLPAQLHARLVAACEALAPVDGRPLPLVWAVQQALSEWLDRVETQTEEG